MDSITPVEAYLDTRADHEQTMHSLVRGLLHRGTEPDRLRAIVLRVAENHGKRFDDVITRIGFVLWHTKRLEGWIQTPTVGEN